MSACCCGSGLEFDQCCGAILSGARKADSAEALMRARYAAFVTGQVDFLHQSLHPQHRQDHDIAATRRWAEKAQWMGLQVVEAKTAGDGDDEAIVEFIATYKEDGIVKPHHEISRFSKQDGEWFYVDGRLVIPKTATRDQPKVGRNDPCPCGSGKKYKKCCGA
ncbi:MAG: YchJ family metal-binding protein [Candidatus Thiodiazotropha sp.]|jgi:SEC-C motif domain protein